MVFLEKLSAFLSPIRKRKRAEADCNQQSGRPATNGINSPLTNSTALGAKHGDTRQNGTPMSTTTQAAPESLATPPDDFPARLKVRMLDCPVWSPAGTAPADGHIPSRPLQRGLGGALEHSPQPRFLPARREGIGPNWGRPSRFAKFPADYAPVRLRGWQSPTLPASAAEIVRRSSQAEASTQSTPANNGTLSRRVPAMGFSIDKANNGWEAAPASVSQQGAGEPRERSLSPQLPSRLQLPQPASPPAPPQQQLQQQPPEEAADGGDGDTASQQYRRRISMLGSSMERLQQRLQELSTRSFSQRSEQQTLTLQQLQEQAERQRRVRQAFQLRHAAGSHAPWLEESAEEQEGSAQPQKPWESAAEDEAPEAAVPAAGPAPAAAGVIELLDSDDEAAASLEERVESLGIAEEEEAADEDEEQEVGSVLHVLDARGRRLAPERSIPVAPYQLTTWEQFRYEQALRGCDSDVMVACRETNVQVLRKDLRSCGPGAWLNDEVINAYMRLLLARDVRRREVRHRRWPRCHFFNSFFLNKLVRDTGRYDYAAVANWSRPTRLKRTGQPSQCLLELDLIIVPCHLGNHWTTAVIDLRCGQIRYYDSLQGHDQELLEALARWVEDERRAKQGSAAVPQEWQLLCDDTCPRQRNGHDCGVFALKFADWQSSDKAWDFEQDDVHRYFRKKVVNEVLDLSIQDPC